MRLETIRRMSMLPFGLSVLLLLGIQLRDPQPPAQPPPAAPRQEQTAERDRLVRQVDALRRTASSTRQWMPLSGP